MLRVSKNDNSYEGGNFNYAALSQKLENITIANKCEGTRADADLGVKEHRSLQMTAPLQYGSQSRSLHTMYTLPHPARAQYENEELAASHT